MSIGPSEKVGSCKGRTTGAKIQNSAPFACLGQSIDAEGPVFSSFPSQSLTI